MILDQVIKMIATQGTDDYLQVNEIMPFTEMGIIRMET